MITLQVASGILHAPFVSLNAEAERERVRRMYADYLGWQPGADEGTGFHLWNLKAPLGGHPVCSTIAQRTLDNLIGIT